MASSAEMVLPEPVGAPSSTGWSVWYSVWKACQGGRRGGKGWCACADASGGAPRSHHRAVAPACTCLPCPASPLLLPHTHPATHTLTCVWMGLKWENLYSASYAGFPRALTGSGSRSRSSAGKGAGRGDGQQQRERRRITREGGVRRRERGEGRGEQEAPMAFGTKRPQDRSCCCWNQTGGSRTHTCVGRVALRQDEALEAHRQQGLGAQPLQ